ncbi:UDP-N-acetylmuramoyl-L-alanyl-D-glutamate--2,6-diaminopimelate ligase [Eggerthia catenaformis]|uniref:UDP-N-acetylmuramoyl-L-alanyl-D-glutamate--2, 6-diaminopimelate ligase n=1 Tax=Eggerthia catenaformis TaxID=31973 RepID=UPI000A382C6D|nr:UDP-N-acetylmuramoyl-L-alanyl-D-glutamate--2,6-diaminopimelate ligase [Eggerthia catenaformis]OUC52281.1 UDP-N-acetylmuramoyl-L-alanyl-D-glutamate--2,6-diaminopimelate ligase [Eggerthia catenaformis]
MRLTEILKNIDYRLLQGNLDHKIEALIYDSRKAVKNTVFIAMDGVYADGHQFINDAVEQGCQVIVLEKDICMQKGITYIKVSDTRSALAHMSCSFFSHPSHELTVIGVTGTVGKTTSALMIYSILKEAGKKVGVIGTNGVYINDFYEETHNTTPESYELNRIMRLMRFHNCDYCVMEVSSQAFKMHRVDGIDFDYGIFTNLSPDHIGPNEHASFEEYRDCKKQLFQLCKIGLFNLDDSHASEMMNQAACQIYTYSTLKEADLYAQHINLYQEPGHMGIRFETGGLLKDFYTLDMPGRFNVYNALVSLFICSQIGIDHADIKRALAHVHIAGRGEVIHVSDDYTVIIDYAHNGAAFESILNTVEEYKPNRVICVYGMPGKRSKVRRIESGEAIARHHAYAVLTADDPRDEKVSDIALEIINAMGHLSSDHYTVVENRKEAIYYALDHALKNDVILILGKGHETHMVLENEVKVHYSDKESVESYRKDHKNA